MNLMRCPKCNQLWQVSEWEKYQILYATKVTDEANWDTESEQLIKCKMIQNRGGIDVSKCLWEACTSNAVKGSYYCIDHLYNTGTRS